MTREVKMSNSLNHELKNLIEDYFLNYPHMSINALSKRTKVGATTLRRILSLSLKGAPNPKTVLNLMSVLTKEKNIKLIIENSPKHTKSYLTESFKHYLEETSSEGPLDLFKNKLKFIIFKLASNQSGVHLKTITKLYGEPGIRVLKGLTKNGHLMEKNELFHARDKKKGNDLHFKAKHLPSLLPLIKKDPYFEPFSALSESLNDEGIKKVNKIQKEALEKISDIMSCPSHSGDHHFFSFHVGGSIKMED
jgi:hypothetical protein